jgi:hypothetical protein
MAMNSWIRLKDPTPPISDDNATMSELRGSARRVKRESDVKTFAVSSVLAPLLFAARRENTVKARIGDTIGET